MKDFDEFSEGDSSDREHCDQIEDHDVWGDLMEGIRREERRERSTDRTPASHAVSHPSYDCEIKCQMEGFGRSFYCVSPDADKDLNSPLSMDRSKTFNSYNQATPQYDCEPLDVSKQSFEYIPILKNDSFDQEEQQDSEQRIIVQTAQGPALLLSGTTISSSPSSRKFQRWSEEEDTILQRAIYIEGGAPHNWKKIAKKYFSNVRTALQCKSRWTKSLQPGVRKGAWSPGEDAIILQLREEGLKWSSIAEHLEGRIGEHVRDRFVNTLDPSLKKGPWSPEEDEILFREQRRIGNKWTQISRVIPGRSENAVKNRWHNLKMTQRRKQRRNAVEEKLRHSRTRTRPMVPAIMEPESFSEEEISYTSIVGL